MPLPLSLPLLPQLEMVGSGCPLPSATMETLAGTVRAKGHLAKGRSDKLPRVEPALKQQSWEFLPKDEAFYGISAPPHLSPCYCLLLPESVRCSVPGGGGGTWYRWPREDVETPRCGVRPEAPLQLPRACILPEWLAVITVWEMGSASSFLKVQ